MEKYLKLPDQSVLVDLLRYNPDTGSIVWRKKPGKSIEVGSPAGDRKRDGRYRIGLLGSRYWTARIIWKLIHGADPQGMVDHINLDRGDNRLCNLRDVTRSENGRNTGISKRNSSGFKYVSYVGRTGKWMALRPTGPGVYKFIGYFSTPKQAYNAYLRHCGSQGVR